MKNISDAILKRNGPIITSPVVTREIATPATTLEIDVLFTDAQATAAALKCAASFARGLGARICLRAGIVVPWQLPLDCPQISVDFVEQSLRRLAEHLDPAIFQPTVQLYVCRNWLETLSQVLNPKSLVVVGGRKHWWPTKASRVAKALRDQGHRVVLVDLKARAAEGLS